MLTGAAPETDAGTAAVLAALPAEFAQGLRLDMAIEAPGPDRLLIAPLPSLRQWVSVEWVMCSATARSVLKWSWFRRGAS